jgi:hypothetical protein
VRIKLLVNATFWCSNHADAPIYQFPGNTSNPALYLYLTCERAHVQRYATARSHSAFAERFLSIALFHALRAPEGLGSRHKIAWMILSL